MSSSRYALAGWLAITHAVLFPLAFVVAIIQNIIGIRVFHVRGPVFGPSDIIFIVSTALIIYVLVMFRNLLNERYNCRDIDTLISLSILWAVVFQIASVVLKTTLIGLWPDNEVLAIIINVSFVAVAMVTIGVIDLMIALRLLRIKEKLNDLIVALAYISMVAGALEVSVVLSPLSLILVPISSVVIGMILLREKEEVEFV
ncbi:MAG: hypothetical protein JSW34_10225 [Candidatus Zixiibacteriota bacterium]|nr:MAG: hypothetical protein JSW34_10225 [candidate division Zixibacteria bacterium]